MRHRLSQGSLVLLALALATPDAVAQAPSAIGDTAHRASWYDRKTLTVLSQKHNAYSVLEMPGTIDAVLDKLAADYEVYLPLSDLLYGDPYPTMMADVLYGKYLGVQDLAATLVSETR